MPTFVEASAVMNFRPYVSTDVPWFVHACISNHLQKQFLDPIVTLMIEEALPTACCSALHGLQLPWKVPMDADQLPSRQSSYEQAEDVRKAPAESPREPSMAGETEVSEENWQVCEPFG